MSNITTVHHKFELSDARLVTVSDLVQDEDSTWFRIVRFYGDPVVNNAPTAFIEVAVRSANEADLKIQAPGFKF